MDNNKSQMQNWKKQIIMDPVLNSLVDPTLSPEQFLIQQLKNLPHSQLVRVYTKLASLKHTISKDIEKQIHHKYQIVQQSFKSTYQCRKDFTLQNQREIESNLKALEKFNQKYQTVETCLIRWKNATKIIHFANAFQKFNVGIKILKTLTRVQKGGQEMLNVLKISKTVKELTELCQQYDFTGINAYQDEKIFVKNCRTMAYSQTEIKLIESLHHVGASYDESDTLQIYQKLIVMDNLGKLRDFTSTIFKTSLKEVGDQLKKCIVNSNNEQCDSNFQNVKISSFAIMFIHFQQILQSHSILKKSGISNLFSKFWQKLVEFMENIIKWNLEQQSKDKDKQAFHISLEINSGKLINQIIWKYPVIFKHITYMCNTIHIFISKNKRSINYEFAFRKEKMVMTLQMLAKRYYQTITNIFAEMVGVNLEPQTLHRLLADGSFFKTAKWLLQHISNEQIMSTVINLLMNVLDIIYKLINQRKVIEQVESFIKMTNEFKIYLQFDKKISLNTVQAYKNVINKFAIYDMLVNI